MDSNQIDVSNDAPEVNSEPRKAKKSYKSLWISLVVLILVALVAAGGWKWYGQISEYQMKQNESQIQIADLQKKIDQLERQKSSSSDTGADDSSNHYLVIKEWNVRMKLTSDIYDAQYKIKVINGVESLYLSTKTLVDINSDCEEIGAGIARNPSDTSYYEMRNIKPVIIDGASYYIGNEHQAPCTLDTNNNSDSREIPLFKALEKATETLEKAQ